MVELIGSELSSPRRAMQTLTEDATFTVWFNKNGNIPDDPPSGPDDFARHGNSGLQIFVGDDDFLDEHTAIYIVTRNAAEGRFIG